MTNQTEKIESIQDELTELEKMYHTITDMAAEHFSPHLIEWVLKHKIVKLIGLLRETLEKQKQYEAERALEDSQEFNKYENE
jgi:hypothetical protein